MVTATADEIRVGPGVVSDLMAIESRMRTISRFDAEALEKIITDITGPEPLGNRFYKGYRGISRWL